MSGRSGKPRSKRKTCHQSTEKPWGAQTMGHREERHESTSTAGKSYSHLSRSGCGRQKFSVCLIVSQTTNCVKCYFCNCFVPEAEGANKDMEKDMEEEGQTRIEEGRHGGLPLRGWTGGVRGAWDRCRRQRLRRGRCRWCRLRPGRRCPS